MKTLTNAPKLAERRSGIALVIVLAFIVLLAGVVVSFFSRTSASRGLSNSSLNQNKADVLAQSATDIIIGDLKQEVVNGSTPQTTGTGAGQTTLYLPTTSLKMVPARAAAVNALSGTDAINNLIRTSGTTALPAPAVVTGSASAALSTGTSANGRNITLSRWNSHYLIPRSNLSGTSIDSTPIASFANTSIVPAWVFVTSQGPTVLASPTTSVIGRYAYAIYDEGGLLDMNAAGTPTATGTTLASFSYKIALACADLTQIPTGATTTLPQSQIDSIIGWRNYASALPSGNFGSFTFDNAAAARYYSSVLSNTTGFLTTSGTSNNGQTDQMFPSRQALLAFRRTTGFSQNALQYMATFTRDLNQPSYTPGSGKPPVLPMSNGGNDAYQIPSADAKINPSFLTIRVNSSFPRGDGSSAVSGEPLVKKRFALNNLAWLTFEGPSSKASSATKTALLDGGIAQATIDQGDDAHIRAYFGLSWDNANKRWNYVHGINGATGRIMTLAEVANANREPDFFELLKASLSIGSLGKAYKYASPTSSTTPDGYQQQKDNSIDAQVIQMGANIIDQFDFDGYPTRILFNDNSLFGGIAQEYRGVEDLPYLYRVREGKVMVRDSAPSQAALPVVSGTLQDAGLGVVLMQPEIWNPHALSPRADAAPRPTDFQIVAVTGDPNNALATTYKIGPWWRTANSGYIAVQLQDPNAASQSISGQLTFSVPTGRADLFREPTILAKPGVPTGSNLGGSTYTCLFPAMQHAANGVAFPNQNFTGLVSGTLPMAFACSASPGAISSGTPATTGTCIFPTGRPVYWSISPSSGATTPAVTYRLQYKDALGNPVTYDEKFALLPCENDCWAATGAPADATNKTFNINYWLRASGNWASNAIGAGVSMLCFDPRTSRFGMQPAGGGGRTPLSLFSPLGYSSYGASNWGWAAPGGSTLASAAMQAAASQNVVLTARPDEYRGFCLSTNTGFSGAYGTDAGPTSSGWLPGASASVVIFPGMFTQNNPATAAATSITRLNLDPASSPALTYSSYNYAQQYFADPDGVVRRAMGAWVPTASGNVAPATAPAAGAPSGLPTKLAYAYNGSVFSPISNEDASRPIILNRPFRSVAELGYVFSGTPWKNLDFSTPESGAAALLDTFCINDTNDPDGLVAGRVNLNTRQVPVLQAILAGAYKDEFNPMGSTLAPAMASSLAATTGSALVNRTTKIGPLMNMGELVGKWNSSVPVGSFVDGRSSYIGFTSDTVNGSYDLTNALSDATEQRISRYREASIRALSASGQTRVWNLMIDVVAQTGRYPKSSTVLDKFVVEGEQRYWVHVAIDRFTGKVIDKQIEVVKE